MIPPLDRRFRFTPIVLLTLVLAPFACDNRQDGPVGPTMPPPGLVPNYGALAGRLPSTDTVTSSVPAFEIKQKGGGIAGRFEITNPNSAAIALDGVNSGTGHALLAWNLGRGRGAVIITSNSNNALPALDVSSQSLGSSTLAAGADIRSNNTSTTNAGMAVSNLGLGTTFVVNQKNTSTTQPAANVTTSGQGTAVVVNHAGSAGGLATFQVAGANKIRFGRNGKGFFNGGTQVGGADVAEAIQVEGSVRDYAPGDVVVISDARDGHVEKSDEAYSTRVIGVYATKPGVLLTDRLIDDSMAGTIPVGVIGIIPTKVTAENGAIRRGDLLVSATTIGHAMRGTDKDRMLGAVIGKALATFNGPGSGVISVLVNVK